MPRTRIVSLQLTCAVLAFTTALHAAELRVGAAAVKITPPLGIAMAGYYFERRAQGTADDLYARAIVLERDGARAALVGLDLISTTRPMVERSRERIQQVAGIPGGHVMIGATHAHTGPVLKGRGQREDSQGGQADLSTQYSDELPAKIAECVRLAAERLQPAGRRPASGAKRTLATTAAS